MPYAILLNVDVLRNYFATARHSDLQYAYYPAYVDLNRHNLSEIIGISEQPLGPFVGAGALSELGIILSSVGRATMYIFPASAGSECLRHLIP